MGLGRLQDALQDLRAVPKGSYLDVGCGRGEMLRHAAEMGFAPVQGVEVVDQLIDGERVIFAEGHALPFPDKSWDVVTLFDVIEHLPVGDDEAVCRELARVAKRTIIVTANKNPSHLPDGTDLHINIRSFEEWDRLFHLWFAPATVTKVGGIRHYPASPAWRVDL